MDTVECYHNFFFLCVVPEQQIAQCPRVPHLNGCLPGRGRLAWRICEALVLESALNGSLNGSSWRYFRPTLSSWWVRLRLKTICFVPICLALLLFVQHNASLSNVLHCQAILSQLCLVRCALPKVCVCFVPLVPLARFVLDLTEKGSGAVCSLVASERVSGPCLFPSLPVTVAPRFEGRRSEARPSTEPGPGGWRSQGGSCRRKLEKPSGGSLTDLRSLAGGHERGNISNPRR